MTSLRGWVALAACVALAMVAGCSRHADTGNANHASSNSADADAFVAHANAQLEDAAAASQRARTAAATASDAATQKLLTEAETKHLVLLDRLIEQSARFDGQALKPETARAIERLRVLDPFPVPHEPANISELAAIVSRLRMAYSYGSYCRDGDAASCRLADALNVLRDNRDFDERLQAWATRHARTTVMRKDYIRFVELANDGAKRLGFANAGEYARARYDMDADALQAQIDRLWSQVKPLHDQLQCYSRLRMVQRYGARAQTDGMIRAHLAVGIRPTNGSDQSDLLVPYPEIAESRAERRAAWLDAFAFEQAKRVSEGQRFLFRPRYGDPFATALDSARLNDVAKWQVNAANSAPSSSDPKATINAQMQTAFNVFAPMAFAMAAEHWRWGVFDGSIKPADYNKAWWAMRAKYEGVAPPTPRDERTFDAGDTYAVADNYPQIGLFLADFLEFQIDRALCKASATKGQTYGCDIEHDATAAKLYRAMLERGASQPWPKILRESTGDDTVDAEALLEYFAPLRAWLERQNHGQPCGWEGNFASGPPSAASDAPPQH